jgi:hypothetical protein
MSFVEDLAKRSRLEIDAIDVAIGKGESLAKAALHTGKKQAYDDLMNVVKRYQRETLSQEQHKKEV